MEFLWPILAKIELICQQTQVSGAHPSSGVPERMTGGWLSGLAMILSLFSITCIQMQGLWNWQKLKWPIDLLWKRNNSVAFDSIMFNDKFDLIPLKISGICCVLHVHLGYVAPHYYWYLGLLIYTQVAMVHIDIFNRISTPIILPQM